MEDIITTKSMCAVVTTLTYEVTSIEFDQYQSFFDFKYESRGIGNIQLGSNPS